MSLFESPFTPFLSHFFFFFSLLFTSFSFFLTSHLTFPSNQHCEFFFLFSHSNKKTDHLLLLPESSSIPFKAASNTQSYYYNWFSQPKPVTKNCLFMNLRHLMTIHFPLSSKNLNRLNDGLRFRSSSRGLAPKLISDLKM